MLFGAPAGLPPSLFEDANCLWLPTETSGLEAAELAKSYTTRHDWKRAMDPQWFRNR